ncbi:hypothetical protein [Jiella marina]|uniref:hypothetical protein n=1 Tax=Jiella sp. LLJ827 TaxID=2917712 RepID=UPI0021010C55|nr:hypothetical protein [Jiella sp. LLJ827]MCQ0986986.1 hypothetical protein [Jiella sp. LLJ827]
MKVQLVTLFFICLSKPAISDVLKIETNNWDLRRELVWTAKLVELNQETGIAEFIYINKGIEEKILVHFTRIYSITFDNDQIVNSTFPPTRSDLTTPLGDIPRSRERILLENDGFLEIPSDVKVVPDRDARNYTLKGGIVSLTTQQVNIEALAERNEQKLFTVPQAAFINWIRG